ncbi:hypothetical protein HG530_010014 [Fusarium avenaceum]|nr:hypothetical protein HG530_010014 [Fusarium avenaceum]
MNKALTSSGPTPKRGLLTKCHGVKHLGLGMLRGILRVDLICPFTQLLKDFLNQFVCARRKWHSAPMFQLDNFAVHLLVQIQPGGPLLDQVKSEFLGKLVDLALICVIKPSSTKIDLPPQVGGSDAQSLAANPIAGFKNDN